MNASRWADEDATHDLFRLTLVCDHEQPIYVSKPEDDSRMRGIMTSRPIVLAFLLVASGVLAQDSQTPTVADASLRLELLKRVQTDRAIRWELIAKGISDEISARMRAIDEDNTTRMKAIVQQYGWPGPELVGKDGSQAAFTLVQHADLAFQKEMLPLVKRAYGAGGLSGNNFALLQDRVLVRDGKPQIYGTQLNYTGPEVIPYPIEDEQNVDRRRAELGMPSLAEYLESTKRALEEATRQRRWREAQPQGSGPYGTVREEVAALPDSTIFRPAQMSAAGTLPIVAFGNGACRNTPIDSAGFLAEIASRGYVVVAGGRVDREFETQDFSRTGADGHPVQITTRKLLIHAVDWAVAENERPGSPYRHKIDTRHIAYMGTSCGGMQALSAASADPRTTTIVVLNGGRLPRDWPVPPGASFPEHFEWTELRAPIAFLLGGPTDGTSRLGRDNFGEIQHLPVFLADLPVGHSGAYPGPDMRWVTAVVGWLDWQLKGRDAGKSMFVGARCGLCSDPAWTVGGQKNLR